MRSVFLFFAFIFLAVSAADADIVVATDGSGDVRSVQAAVDKISPNNKTRVVIRIKPGIYTEQVRVPADKPYVSFIGESSQKTKITFNLSNKIAGSTSASYSIYIGGSDFYAENITFENSFGKGSQAVAVMVEADRAVFKNCRFIGWQDTLYAKNGRQYYKDCYIEGNVDFIFGQAAAVFENCRIQSKGDGYIAAPMRFAANEPSGFVFVNCKLTGVNTQNGVFLGRPWRQYGRAVFLNTEMGSQIRAEGWNNWNNPANEKTAYFAEYNSKGKGAKPEARAKWAHQLTPAEASQFETAIFLKGNDGWNPKKADNPLLEKTLPDFALVTWNQVLKQNPLWYATDEAARIADQVVLYQKDNGGWEKNIDMAAMLTQKEKDDLIRKKSDISETTIDNGTTYQQLEFLAKVITASMAKPTPPNNFLRHKDAFAKGLDYLFAAQYENGGFPQFFPLRKGYYSHITFNDNAMIGVLKLFRKITNKDSDFLFVDQNYRLKAETAVQKAIPLILKLQVVVDGKKTIWAAQYDQSTLKPANARAFEPASLTAGESVGIVRFLMQEKPMPEIAEAIESAIEWYGRNKIEGISWERRNGENVVIKDKNALPIWARFYQIETMKPIFIGRDAIIRYDISEIEAERRNGYQWYVSEPNELLNKDYPKWRRNAAISGPLRTD